MATATERSKAKTGANAVVFTVLVLLAVVFANIILYRWFKRVDLTEDHAYTLSQPSKDLVAKLPDQLSVKAFISNDLQPPFTQTAQYVRDLLAEYANASNGKLKWEAIDPGEDSKLEEEATKLKVPKMQRGRVSNNKVEIGASYLGIAFQYQGNIESIPEISGTEGLEYRIDKLIRLMTQKKMKIAFATSEGELSTQAGPQGQGGGLSILKQEMDFFDVVPVQLNQGAKPIPDDAVALVIAGPKQQFTERAKYEIDQFLMKGKSVAFFVDGMILEQPQQMHIPGQTETPRIGRKNDTGLEDLLAHYGLAVHDDLILEPGKNVAGPVPVGGQMLLANYPAFLATDTIAKSSPLMEKLSGIILPWTSSVELLKDKQQTGLVITELATSSNQSWRQKGFFLFNPEAKLKPSDEHGPFPLAYALEGKFKSFFAGKPHPDEKGAEVAPAGKNESVPPGTEVSIDQAEAPGRLLLVGSSTWISDQNISLTRYVQAYQLDLMFALNAIDWLAQDRTLSLVRNKTMKQRLITIASESTPTMLQAINIVLIPVVFIIFGIVRWRLRAARRAQAKL